MGATHPRPHRLALCWYDPRNPNHIPPEPGEVAQTPRSGCACDNCFYGRDALAVELIAARAQRNTLAVLLGEVRDHAMKYGGVPKSADLLWARVGAAIEEANGHES